MTYIDTLVVIPQNISIHIFDNFKILLPFGCVMVSSIIWMFHEQRTETRELAVFISALFLALLTILHVVVLRVVSKFTFINVRFVSYSKHSNWHRVSKLASKFGCLFTFCYSAEANLFKTKFQACNLQTSHSISYKYVNWFWLNLPHPNSKQ